MQHFLYLRRLFKKKSIARIKNRQKHIQSHKHRVTNVTFFLFFFYEILFITLWILSIQRLLPYRIISPRNNKIRLSDAAGIVIKCNTILIDR